MKWLVAVTIVSLSGCASWFTVPERKSDTITATICFFSQCTINESTRAANQESVEGGLNKTDAQQIEQSLEARLQAQLSATQAAAAAEATAEATRQTLQSQLEAQQSLTAFEASKL